MHPCRIKLSGFFGLMVSIMVITGLILPGGNIVRAEPTITYYRVASIGSDQAGCGSETLPCQSIQYAVNSAASGDVITVAGGIYTYNANADTCSFLVTRAVVCFVDKNLTILGGYSPNNWGAANPGVNPTVIDGQSLKRGVAIIAYNSTASLRMEDFTIQNGLAQGASSGSDFEIGGVGGGMWGQNSSVTLKRVTFKINRAIGGSTNTDYGGGGTGGGLAIQSTKNNVPSNLENVTFDGNQALGGTGKQRGGVSIGGGLFLYDATITGTNLVFTNNSSHAGNSTGNGFAIGLRADALGGAAGFQYQSTVSFQNVTARGNQAIGGNAGTGTGGGGFGGAFHVEQSTLTINIGHISDNQAQGGNGTNGGVSMGGGLMTDATNGSLNRMQFIKNTSHSGSTISSGSAGSASGGGAEIAYFSSSQSYSVDVVNSIFGDNRIELGSGNSSNGGGGGGLMVHGQTVNIIHSTFANNQFGPNLSFGQAIQVQGYNSSGGQAATANIKYSIISDHIAGTNSSALTVVPGNTANLNRVMFAGNTNNTNLNGHPYAPGTINGFDPGLVVSSINYVSPASPNYNYHLQSSSPAIDMATGSTTPVDIDGDPRPYNGGYDIGADEYTAPALVSSPASVIIMVDQHAETTRFTNINCTSGASLDWIASTSTVWLYLGLTGSSHQTSGTTGGTLILRANPNGMNLGSYDAIINITGQNVVATTVTVHLIVVEHLLKVFIPIISH